MPFAIPIPDLRLVACRLRGFLARARRGRWGSALLLAGSLLFPSFQTHAVILWSDPDATLVQNNGAGTDLLRGALRRDDLATDTLYFKLHINPLSDDSTEPYFAALQLFERGVEQLAVGNALKASAYSAFFGTMSDAGLGEASGYLDLNSSKPDTASPGAGVRFQSPRRNIGITILFKVQYVAGSQDLITLWLDPDLGPGASELHQPESLTTRFGANASFDEIRLLHGGAGAGWTFSDMAIATSFSDFVDISSASTIGEDSEASLRARELYFRSWLPDPGLHQAPVRSITQTADGCIWLATDFAITRFDGQRFTTPLAGVAPTNLPAPALFGDSSGGLWIGTAGRGAYRWDRGLLTPITTAQGLASDSITSFAERKPGEVWIGTRAGITVWNSGIQDSAKSNLLFQGQAITALTRDRSGTLWIGVKGSGIFQMVGETAVPVAGPAGDNLLRDSHSLLVDHSGRLWVGAGDHAVLCRDGDRWQSHQIPSHLAKPFMDLLVEEANGTIWAGSAGGGLLHGAKGRFSELHGQADLPGSPVHSLFVDREGMLWLGTGNGLARLQRHTVFTLGQGDGLGHGAVQSLAEVSPGVIWAAKPGDGIYRRDGRGFNRLPAAGLDLHGPRINTLLPGRDGTCWAAGANGLLRYKDPVAAADESRYFPIPGANVIALAGDAQGSLWVGAQDGTLRQLREGAWIARNDIPSTNPITCILPARNGSIWVGTHGGGLFRMGTAAATRLSKTNGLASDNIQTLYEDSRETLWIGTAGGGLSRWHGGRTATVTAREGLPDDTISQILEDDSGRLWLGTRRGIACLLKSGFEEVAAGRAPAVYPKVFGASDGMTSQECTGNHSPAGLKSSSGFLWFSTTKGVVAISPGNHPLNEPVLTTVLEEVLVDGIPDPTLQSGAGTSRDLLTLHVPPGRHRIELRYSAISFAAPQTTRFRYKLEGLDHDWVDSGAGRAALYNYVPPGSYRFHVIACNSDGVWADRGAQLQLLFHHHFWQSWWFLILAGAGTLTAVGLAARLIERQRTRSRLLRLEQEHALEQERSRIARDLHDEMGSKLCRISFLSEHARRAGIPHADLLNQINAISDDSRDILHSLDEIVWAVNPQNDSLEHVASYITQYSQDYLQMTGIDLELAISPRLPAHPVSSHTRHQLFLAVREALTNILKHSRASRATITLTCEPARFEISIRDNGRGFRMPSSPDQPAPVPGEKGNGLENMPRRLAEIGGGCSITSSPGLGTTVTFTLPLKPLQEPDSP